MSTIRNVFTNFKNLFTNLRTQENRNQIREEDPEPEPSSSSNRLQNLFSFATKRKRPEPIVFEPEITDDEDDFPVYSSYQGQPQNKRLRSEPFGFGMSSGRSHANTPVQHKYVTRGSGIPPGVEGLPLAKQPWQFNFNFGERKPKLMNKPSNDKEKPEPSTARHRMNTNPSNTSSKMGLQDKDEMYWRSKAGSKTASSEKHAIEVITLDDDDSTEQTTESSVNKPKSLEPSSKELKILKAVTSPIKHKRGKDSNPVSKFLGMSTNFRRKFGEMMQINTVRLHEKDEYKKLLDKYASFSSTVKAKYTKALTKSIVDHQVLQAMYRKTSPSSLEGNIDLRITKYDPRVPIYTSRAPLIPPIRLFSTTDQDTDSIKTFGRESSTSRLAIQDVPEVIDLEPTPSTSTSRGKELSPITSRQSRENVSIATPSSPVKSPFAGNFSNLQDALNTSNVFFEESKTTSEDLALEPPQVSQDVISVPDDEEIKDDMADLSIISEKVINKSRKVSVNTLALEQTSCHYVDKNWLEESRSEWRERQQQREEKIREESRTLAILHNESTIHKDRDERIRKKLTLTEYIVLEEPPEDIPELTDEMMAIIDHAKARGNSNETLAQVRLAKDTISITRGDIQSLGPCQWLNDNVINTYMGLIVMRSKQIDNYPTVYAFQTFFYPKLLKEGYSNSLKRWTRRDDIFAHDLIIFPIHLGMHWCLACADIRKKSIRYFDSLGGDNNRCLQALLDYLSQEMKERKQVILNKSEWTLQNVKGIPHQQNGSDCGMFSCKFAEYLSRDKDFTFTQELMPYYRNRMIYELIRSDLMHP